MTVVSVLLWVAQALFWPVSTVMELLEAAAALHALCTQARTAAAVDCLRVRHQLKFEKEALSKTPGML